LRNENANYDQKRSHDIALEPLKIMLLPKDTFNKFFKRFKKLGGQNKVQKLKNNRSIVNQLDQILTEIREPIY